MCRSRCGVSIGLLLCWLGVALAGCDQPSDVIKCAIGPGDPSYEAIETRCDGTDNDCDGQTDVLLPIALNACSTDGKGACASGFAGCNALDKQCLTPPSMPESRNGIDDDCDGIVDNANDVTAAMTRARVLLAPPVWEDVDPTDTVTLNTTPLLSFTEALSQAGIAYDAPDANTATVELDFADALAGDLSRYSMLLLPGYVDASFFTPEQLARVRAWVAGGGALVLVKPMQPETDDGGPPLAGSHEALFLDLAGVVTQLDALNVDTVEVTANAPAMFYLDSATERMIWVISRDPDATSPDVAAYVPNPKAGTQVFGTALAGGKPQGATWLRRPLGKGVVYTLGWDPLQDAVSLCDLNCFSPGRDIGVDMLRAIAQEAAHGHAVWKHTVPGVESTVLVITHDIDAPDSHNANPSWGAPGALQSAQIEKDLGIKGSYMITTDYYVGYYNPAIIPGLCDLGSCPEAAHSVRHMYMTDMVEGDCKETKANYDPANPTVCGEMRVSREILNDLLPADQQIEVWRTPYLEPPPFLYETLDKLGIMFDTSYSQGDANGNLPIYVPRSPDMREAGGLGNVYTMPLVEEDGIGDILDDGTQTRWELQAANTELFMGKWTWAFLENMRNNSWNTYLLHPSYGIGTNSDNLAVKLETMKRFLSRVLTYDMRVERISAAAKFWRGRDQTQVDASYQAGKGYAGTIQVGPFDAPQFSLEFGDNIANFDCPGGGTVHTRGRRVVFDTVLKAGTKLVFTATVP